MDIKIKHVGSDFQLEAKNEDGNIITIDASKDIGGAGKGMRPMQLLLASLGGCSAIDVLMILRKQRQFPRSFEVTLKGIRKKSGTYSLFKSIEVHFVFSNDIKLVKAENAVRMSMEKYCSVAKTLEPIAKITYKIIIK